MQSVDTVTLNLQLRLSRDTNILFSYYLKNEGSVGAESARWASELTSPGNRIPVRTVGLSVHSLTQNVILAPRGFRSETDRGRHYVHNTTADDGTGLEVFY